MIRLGFWKPKDLASTVTEKFLKEESELHKELRSLIREQPKYADKETILEQIRKERMEASKKRRKELKEQKEANRLARAARWEQLQQDEILYLGEEVSGGLNNKSQNADLLTTCNLPNFENVSQLALAMGLKLGELRFLSFNRRVSKVSHYKRFLMPKKAGGHRLISAPMPRLKAAQHWILENILNIIPIHSAAHGFVIQRSIVSNAAPHVGAELVINLDLKDFFPTVSYKRVKGLFRSLGYSEQIATILGLICSEPETEQVQLDGETYYVATSDRHLPQGAPTSPALTNILCYRFDRRIQGIANKHGFKYTRYADDLSFSRETGDEKAYLKLMWCVRKVIAEEGFILHPDKIRVMRKGSRQEVTGLVVNDKVNINRKLLRNFRALIFQIEKDGIQDKTWLGKKGMTMLAAIEGYVNFIKMVDQAKGKRLSDRINPILERYNFKQENQS